MNTHMKGVHSNKNKSPVMLVYIYLVRQNGFELKLIVETEFGCGNIERNKMQRKQYTQEMSSCSAINLKVKKGNREEANTGYKQCRGNKKK